MQKWIVVMLVVGFVGAARAEDNKEHTPAPSIDKKEEVKPFEDKTAKLFRFINACMATQPAPQTDLTPQPK